MNMVLQLGVVLTAESNGLRTAISCQNRYYGSKEASCGRLIQGFSRSHTKNTSAPKWVPKLYGIKQTNQPLAHSRVHDDQTRDLLVRNAKFHR